MGCLFLHKWNGCVCEKCGKKRDGKCVLHQWNGCICEKCGKKRDGEDTLHQWNGCICEKCGKKQNIQHASHQWNGCICEKCGTIRDVGHEWHLVELPGNWIEEKCDRCKSTRNHSYRCPKCGEIGKITYDEFTEDQGFYGGGTMDHQFDINVYDDYRQIRCLACGFKDKAEFICRREVSNEFDIYGY